MAVIEFEGYKVLRTSYARNDKFNGVVNSTIELTPELTAQIHSGIEEAEIELGIKVGSLENKYSPFEVEVMIKGQFSYNLDEDESEFGFENFLRLNGTAIMYPYVRALVSTLTNSSNEYPGFKLPTINIGKVLADQENERKEQS